MKAGKLRPYISKELVSQCRAIYPRFSGDDAAFIEWILQSFSAGALTFGGFPHSLVTTPIANQSEESPDEDEDDLLGDETD
ncbi:hypothetical protein [Leptolyngbya sp. GGD]|uniref:hypothetical protein n=1 Tax=Leptolyngbya sp. GGD TaxID=2997907 RepID=UPI00227C7564|nr:hypothetical protein [Leptolyngbya sp. GGD]MCY6491919.1 hypothetical protein [Leptolyngbya sp. GGD]